VLLAKTLTSSTFRLALIAIGAFGVIVSAIFGYVYLSTSSYVRSRSDRAIMADYLSLQGAYERNGRAGLIVLIQQRMTDKSFADGVYILVDPSLATLRGNIKVWPATVAAATAGTPDWRLRLRKSLANTKRTDDFLATRIMNGKPGRMPAFGGNFDDQQLNDLIAFIHSIKPEGTQ